MKIYNFTDSYGTKRKGVKKKCRACDKSFLTRLDQPANFCSRICMGKHQRKRVSVECAICKVEVERTLSKLKNSKSGFFFCSQSCKNKAQRLGGIKEIMPPHYGTANNYRQLFEENEFVCVRCGYDEFTCSVEIHHIDENNKNNSKRNLMPLCSCCHRALHNGLWKIEELVENV